MEFLRFRCIIRIGDEIFCIKMNKLPVIGDETQVLFYAGINPVWDTVKTSVILDF
jgi:hypothetical protein